MKHRFCRILSLITCIIMGTLALCAAGASAEEESTVITGKPFPDFTVTDTEGNLFTLSEALKDHEAVLINFWATWCGPCRNEFPFLNEAYGKYRDRVAFIALSTDSNDTIEKIGEYRAKNGISFPMGRDEGKELYRYISGSSIPDTVVVDRFGNAVFFHAGVFRTAKEAELVLDAFLGDGYTETAVLDAIPRDTSTRSFPASAARAIYPDSGNYQKVIIHSDAYPGPVSGYIVPDDSVRLRIEIAAEDDVDRMVYGDLYQMTLIPAARLLDQERGVYLYDQSMPDPSASEQYTCVSLSDSGVDEDAKELYVFLFRNEESIREMAEVYAGEGLGEVRWEYADTDEKAGSTLQAYIMHVVDQDGSPVEGVTVNFCTDTSCVPKESDEDGLITFTGAPDVYHVQIIDVPDGYSWDEDYEMYTAREYGEWGLRVRKDD